MSWTNNIPSILPQDRTIAARLRTNLFRRPKGQELLHVNAAVEAQPIAEVRAGGDQIIARVAHTIEPLGRRIADVERILQDLSNRFAALQENLAADLSGIEQSLTKHEASIDSSRTAMAQTDDLVERVVEALELLQGSVLDQHEERAALID